MPKQIAQFGRNWYVLHTYSGYEDTVARNLRQRIESMDMQDKIFSVVVPKEKKVKMKSGKRYTTEERIYPGYVLVEMIVDDASWYVVRNTPRVTGFVGSGTTPAPIDPAEVEEIMKRMGVDEPEYEIDVEEGDPVRLIDGPFKDMEGTVQEIDEQKGKIKVLVDMFGRETPVELDFLQIERI